MENTKIDLKERTFVSTLSEPKLCSIADSIMTGKCKYVETLPDYYSIGDVFIFEINEDNVTRRVAYGELGRVELSHIDLNTCQMTEPSFLLPLDNIDYGWLMGVALFNRNYTKFGMKYLDYVEEILLSSISKRKFNTKEEQTNNNLFCNKLHNNFVEMNTFYNYAIKTIGDALFPAEEEEKEMNSTQNPVFIRITEYLPDQ